MKFRKGDLVLLKDGFYLLETDIKPGSIGIVLKSKRLHHYLVSYEVLVLEKNVKVVAGPRQFAHFTTKEEHNDEELDKEEQ